MKILIMNFSKCLLYKFELETQPKTLTHIVDKIQVGIKDNDNNYFIIKCISKVLKLVKVILTVPVTNAVSERSCSALHRFKFYLRSFMTQELLSSCLIIATYKEKANKLKLVEVTNQFYFENEHRFSI